MSAGIARRPTIAYLASAVAGAVLVACVPLQPLGYSGAQRAYARPASVSGVPASKANSPRAKLGRRLFFDPRLSANGARSCASCHDPERGWQDGLVGAKRPAGDTPPRRTPTLWDNAWGRHFFADGRAATLEEQALIPIQSPREMGQRLDSLVGRLRADSTYPREFRDAFPERVDLTPDLVASAIATFERSIVSPDTRVDRWIAGDTAALTAKERRGFSLFVGSARCARCHSGWRFTDDEFHDVGLPDADLGRGGITGRAREAHSFKTPTLRDVARRAPYMHDGSLSSLEVVVRHYQDGLVRSAGRAREVPRIALDSSESDALVSFLRALSVEPH